MAKKKSPNLSSMFQSVRADYEMSRDSRFVRKRLGLPGMGGSADYHLRNERDYYDSVEKARDMDRNDSIIGQTIDRAVANIIQDGFTYSPKTGNRDLDDQLYARWMDFANDPDQCDLAGEMCWHDFERLTCRSMFVDGDSIVWVTDGGPLQFIESHQIQTSTKIDDTFCGITLDRFRKRETYWYRSDAINPNNTRKGEDTPIPTRNANGQRQVCHIYTPRRAYMTRGVTALAPIMYIAGMFEDVNFAKVVQQQIVSCFAIFRERPAGAPPSPPSTQGYGDRIETGETGISVIDGISPGLEIRGADGEKLHGFSPNVPNAEYFDHVRLLLQIIGVNLGLPLCLVLMDGSETNFSGWRGAVDEARKGFRTLQRGIVKRLSSPTLEMKITQWIESDPVLQAAVRDGFNLYAHDWQTPEWKYINPKDDAEADAAQLRNCLTSPRRLMGARGAEWETIVDETVADNIYAIRTAKKAVAELNAELQDSQPLHWRDVLPLVLPANTNLSLQDPAVIESSNEDEAQANNDSVSVESTESTGSVQSEALNGAQVGSLVSLIEQVAAGTMPKQSAKSIIAAAFPLFTPQQIESIIEPIIPGSIPSVNGTPAIGPDGQPTEERTATGEMSATSTLQFKRNRKAIENILTELQAGEISEAKARVLLSSIGLVERNIDALVADALDGSGRLESMEGQADE